MKRSIGKAIGKTFDEEVEKLRGRGRSLGGGTDKQTGERRSCQLAVEGTQRMRKRNAMGVSKK